MNNRGRGLNTFSFWKGQSGLPCSYTPSIAGGMPMQTIIHRPVPIVMPSLDLGVGDARRTDPPSSRQAVLKPLWKIGKEASCGDKDNTDISLRLAGVMSALRKAGVKLRADRLGVHHSIHHGLNHGCSNNSTTNLADSRQCHSLHEFRQQPGSSSGSIGSAVPKISYW
ncbi:uncharacterized protein [Drosophila bipectinata]|uniref:uncharacterized protein n=1 Tax=Drosophila bipectinata TaxID=42026 RepID=UPI001C8AAD14|nr:uncharacterized protein LOC108123652 [Drosophila bipectinata]